MTTPYNPFRAARATRIEQKKARKRARRINNRGNGGRLFKPVQPRPRPTRLGARSIESTPRRLGLYR